MKKDFQQWMGHIGMALLAVVVSAGIVETYGYPNDNKTTYIITWE